MLIPNIKFISASKSSVLLTGVFLVAFIGILDSVTGSEISFSIFYLIPITFVSWYLRRSWGLLFAILSAITWFLIDTQEAHRFSVAAIHYWNALVRLGFFLIVVYLVSELRLYKTNLEQIIAVRTSDLQKEVEEHEKAKNEIIRKTNQLRELTRKMETIKEEESVRIAREIHDELGQSLTAINLEVMWVNKKYSNIPDLKERTLMINRVINDTIKSVRRISSSLRPRLLDQLGLLPAIESLTKEFQKKTGIKCFLDFHDEMIEIGINESATMFRIFQEALTNVARHSKATKVYVSIIKESDNELKMCIRDNGKGMDKTSEVKGLGILGMNERALSLGGNLELNSIAESGTEVILKIPLESGKFS